MKIVKLMTVVAISAMTIMTATAQKSKLVTPEDSLSYALGVANYKYYVADSINISTKMFTKGMTDASKDKALMNDTTASAFIVTYMQRRERARLMAEYGQQIEAAKAYLEENGKKDGVVTLPSGLQYTVVITQATGAHAGPGRYR
ncbi:MAG: FKBP-type peptidyl-prolyl cis-trans isomerase N-terminal domain-containing protein [Bacteroidales bacterium]|nr:FKBP-type peptidyl-prolyl cis-trans isomerase N-terminal domain-containing protein [Bacteroidales bacterium]